MYLMQTSSFLKYFILIGTNCLNKVLNSIQIRLNHKRKSKVTIQYRSGSISELQH
jgi:hypothetical protein